MYHFEGILSRALDGNRTYAQLNISWYSVSRRALQNHALSTNYPFGIINQEIGGSDTGSSYIVRVGNTFFDNLLIDLQFIWWSLILYFSKLKLLQKNSIFLQKLPAK